MLAVQRHTPSVPKVLVHVHQCLRRVGSSRCRRCDRRCPQRETCDDDHYPQPDPTVQPTHDNPPRDGAPFDGREIVLRPLRRSAIPSGDGVVTRAVAIGANARTGPHPTCRSPIDDALRQACHRPRGGRIRSCDAMPEENMRAYSSRRALRTLSELSRSMARAESREELLELTGGCLRELGFRSYLADLEGDRFRLIADRLETESIARVETILGQPLSIRTLQTNAIPCIHTAATKRSPATTDDLAASLMTLVPHLSGGDRAALRLEIGSGPFTAIPVERGDELLGVLITWRNGAGGSGRVAVPASGGGATRPRLASRRPRSRDQREPRRRSGNDAGPHPRADRVRGNPARDAADRSPPRRGHSRIRIAVPHQPGRGTAGAERAVRCGGRIDGEGTRRGLHPRRPRGKHRTRCPRRCFST